MSLDIEQLRRQLCARRDELLSLDETERAANATVELDQSRVGRLSRMDALQAQAISQATTLRRQDELQRISLALRRIDTDEEFGYCQECGKAIAQGRLVFDPTMRLCVACAEAQNGE